MEAVIISGGKQYRVREGDVVRLERLPTGQGDTVEFREVAYLRAEARRRLRDAIDGLPADYRTAFVLHDMEGLSNPEIAEILGISLPAVKSRVHRSRLFLRHRLEQYFRRG